MEGARWQRLQELFHQALALEGAARNAFLDQVDAQDKELREELESLLTAHGGTTGFFSRGPAPTLRVDPFEQADLSGERIGAYRLLRRLGHGGMGVVYLGERADGEFRQQVAIKLVRSGSLTPPMLARFRGERQILAQLEHPNITRLLDGGSTLLGQPYLVMEYVAGEPIDAYCARNGLSTHARLRLFLDVCTAVAYAHRQLVVHRDLKPGNTLVTRDGQVKLLDFGIAKLLAGDLATDESARNGESGSTFLLSMALTPEYASPEQLRGEPVTTASDIYSLGVLLYELLTGMPPYRFKAQTLREVEKLVCETPVARPSTAVARTLRSPAGRLGSPASARDDVSLARLQRELSGDLDTIVLMALRKHPDSRYRSVEQFADDVGRYLGGYPIVACPPSRRYRLRKFLRRNALTTASAAAVFLALIVGAIAAWTGMREAQRQTALAEARQNELVQVVRFQQSMLSGLDPHAMGGSIVDSLRRRYREALIGDFDEVQINDGLAAFEAAASKVNAADLARGVIDEFVLHRAAAAIERDFSDRPRLQTDLYDSVFEVYLSIGLNASLLDLSERMVVSHAGRAGEDAASLLARYRLAQARVVNGQLQAAEADLRAVLADADDDRPELREVVWRTRDKLAQVRADLGQLDEARAIAEANLDIAAAHFDDPRIHLLALHTLGYVSARAQRTEDALRYSLEAAARVQDDQHPDYIRTYSNLAAAQGELERLDESLETNERLLAALRISHGERHPQTLRIMNNLGANLLMLDRAEEAAEYLERAVVLRGELFGTTDATTLRSMLNLASAYARIGRRDEALELLQTVADQRLVRLGPNHADTLSAQEMQASVLAEMGRYEDALPITTHVRDLAVSVLGERHRLTLRKEQMLASIENLAGRYAEAERISAGLLDFHATQSGADHPQTLEAARLRYHALIGLGDDESAGQIRAAYLQPLLDADPADLDRARRQIRERLSENSLP